MRSELASPTFCESLLAVADEEEDAEEKEKEEEANNK
jgi:hypothetical protein